MREKQKFSKTRATFLLFLWGLFIIFLHQTTTWPVWATETLSETITAHLRSGVGSADRKKKFVCQGEIICGISVIPRFYRQRDFKPAWISDKEFSSQAKALIAAIQVADQEGLNPEDYHLAKIKALLAEAEERHLKKIPPSAKDMADFDLLLTDSFLMYSSHLLAGRVNPERIHTGWFVFTREVNLVDILQAALDTNQIRKTLDKLKPSHPGYTGLGQMLIRYRKIAKNGGWPHLVSGSSLKIGDRGERVEKLRKRLLFFDDSKSMAEENGQIFDEQLDEVVRGVQEIYGLKSDGIVGPETRAALNVPAKARARQIELNMERWRWIPRNLGQRYILVNIADFKLSLIEHGETVMDMRVVVGRTYRRTPVFSSKMKYIVLNPFWNVPMSIAVKDILPKLRENHNYLSLHNMTVYANWQTGAPSIDPRSIDWSKVNRRGFRYRLVQKPGPQNALGRLKFMFPNRFSVYLHDTPGKELFQKNIRSFSSGCIRAEKPVKLAVYLLKDDPNWTKEKIMAAVDRGKTRSIGISNPLNVHLLYWTAWVDKTGEIHFRDDIYDRDRPLDKALAERPPRP